jgi:hypothetical protein
MGFFRHDWVFYPEIFYVILQKHGGAMKSLPPDYDQSVVRQTAEDIQRRLLEYELDPRNFTQAMRQANRQALMRGQHHPRLTRPVI